MSLFRKFLVLVFASDEDKEKENSKFSDADMMSIDEQFIYILKKWNFIL
jgi:hypothetical protein